MSSPSMVMSKAELMVFIDCVREIHQDLQDIKKALRELDKTIQDQSTMIKEDSE